MIIYYLDHTLVDLVLTNNLMNVEFDFRGNVR